jgi:fatty acid amide hydrolase
MSATELVSQISQGKITSVQALLFFAAMSAESHKRYNCLTNVMFTDALKRALELDQIYQTTGRVVGPLHGLPISIKECIAIKGTHSTAGLAKYLDKVAEEDAVVVKLLKEAGAIIYVKSNIPQTMLISDCSNPIYGRTVNPYNPKRTSGGSSGGEGVLVASGGAPMGVGTDIGGSIRMPGAWCGIMGMMPTGGRFTSVGNSPEVFPGIETLQATCGPIVRFAEDAVLFYRVLSKSNMSVLDPLTPPVAFDEQKYTSKEKLVIGYFINDGHFTPSVAAQRAVMLAAETLRQQGHTVVQFQPHNFSTVVRAFFTFVSGDGAWNLRSILDREKIDPCIADVWKGMTAPWIVRFVMHSLLNTIGWKRLANIIPVWSGSAQYEHQMVSFRGNYRKEMIARMKDAGIDAILCPGPAIPAPLHNQAQLMAPALASTYYWNVLKFPAASMAITTVQPQDLATPRTVNDLTDMIANKGDVDSEGLPIPVQIVSYPWGDEIVLRVANDLSSLRLDLSDKLRSSIAASLQ